MREADGRLPIHDKADEIVENYYSKKLRENEERVMCIPEDTPIDEVQDILKDVNWWIYSVAKDSRELYDAYKYRLLKTNDGYLIVQGEDIDTEPEEGK